MLRDEIAQLSTELSAARLDLSDLERQLSDQCEANLKIQRDAANKLEESRLNSESCERDLQRTKEVIFFEIINSWRESLLQEIKMLSSCF